MAEPFHAFEELPARLVWRDDRRPADADRLQVTYTPVFGANKRLVQQITSLLRPRQWIELISRIGQIPEPAVPTAPSKYAITAAAAGPH